MTALKDDALCLTPSTAGAALPAQALSQDLSSILVPLTFHLLTCAAPGGGNGVGAQGLRCLNRCPSLLPGLAVAKTRTHHRNGTGCWGRETSKAQEEELGAGESLWCKRVLGLDAVTACQLWELGTLSA